MTDIQNANPTVLSASQLPTRQRKKTTTDYGPETKYSRLVFDKDVSSSDQGSDYTEGEEDVLTYEPIDEQEIYDLIAPISDPEHPVSLGQLSVINLPDIHITPSPSLTDDPNVLREVLVEVTPTITHCSLATVIGLGVRVRLEQALPPNYRVDVRIKPGTHEQDDQVDKQLSDKERVAAAQESESVKNMLNKMLEACNM